MNNKQDLTQGAIFPTLIRLAIPIMLTSFIQMFYNMTDMFWIGRVGSNAVAAVGTAGFYVWFCFSLILITKVGGEVNVSQAFGRKDFAKLKEFAQNAIQLNLIFAIIYGIITFIFADFFISLLIDDPTVREEGIKYLEIVSFGMVFTFLNPLLSGIFNGSGDSKTPFVYNTFGLVVNIILDPLLIFGIWIFPKLGVTGAAIATVFSQAIVTLLFCSHMFLKQSYFKGMKIFALPIWNDLKSIIKLGLPVGTQSGLFTIFAMVLAKIVNQWGPLPIAVQKVGAQIEAISWMTANGFSAALSAFVGQNFGANKWERIWKGYFAALAGVSIFGAFATILFIWFGQPVFAIFLPEPEAIEIGRMYLKILGLSQLFMCIEIVTAGGFNGLGKTLPPSIVSTVLTGMRIPLGIFLSLSSLELLGIWWSISLTSIFKGIILFVWFLTYLNKHPDVCAECYIKNMIFIWDWKYLRDKKSISGK